MSRLPEITKRLEEMIKPFFENTEIQLVELNVKFRQHVLWIQLLVDKPLGGITIDECSQLNRRLIQKIAEENFLTEDYEVEVSSPGLDRPLRTKSDFKRATNRPIRVLLKDALFSKWEYTGQVRRLEDETLILDCNSQEIAVPFAKIMKATPVI